MAGRGFLVALSGLAAISISASAAAEPHAAEERAGVLMTCSVTKSATVAGIDMPVTHHFHGRGETIDEAEARFGLSSGAEDFASCTDFRAVWVASDARRKYFQGKSAVDLARQLMDAGAPAGAVGRWKQKLRGRGE